MKSFDEEDSFIFLRLSLMSYPFPESVKSISVIDLIHCEPYVYQKASLNLTGEAAFFNKHLTGKQ